MNKGHAIQVSLTLGELLMIWDSLDRMPKCFIVRGGDLESGASFEDTDIQTLKDKIKEQGMILEYVSGGTVSKQ